MSVSPRIGVVTVTYNSGAVLTPFLNCIFSQTTKDFLTFAVDNASKDNTLEILKGCNDPRLIIIANSENLGVAEGNNQGIRAALHAGCDYILLLNNDTEFGPELLASLEQGLRRYDADMICPKIMYFDDPNRIWAAGGRFQPWFGYRAVHLGADQIDDDRHSTAKPVSYAPTCCVLIRKEVFQEIGFIDERYFVYFDDVDFMYRAMKRGIKLVYDPDSSMLHKVGRLTGGEDSPFTHRYCTRNRVFFTIRHFGIFRSLPVFFFYQLHFIAALLFGKITFDSFRIKERAVIEGLSMWKQSTH